MISICMNDRQHVITNVWAPICMSGNQSMYLSYFFLLLLFFFHHSKIIIIVFF